MRILNPIDGGTEYVDPLVVELSKAEKLINTHIKLTQNGKPVYINLGCSVHSAAGNHTTNFSHQAIKDVVRYCRDCGWLPALFQVDSSVCLQLRSARQPEHGVRDDLEVWHLERPLAGNSNVENNVGMERLT